MKEWAKREIELACKNENPDRKEGEFDYGCACYESALKAFESLLSDGHSGFSISMTKHILNRLIDGKPLTPIEDTEDAWNDISHMSPKDNYTLYQCKRMSSLFKYVYGDGKIEYKDNDASYCINIDTKSTYHNGFVQGIIREMYPITMPYMPGQPIKIYCEELLTDKKNGDYDTINILYIIKPDGEKVNINRYFKEIENGWAEIDVKEFTTRYAMSKDLI